jgi:glycogen operon protein
MDGFRFDLAATLARDMGASMRDPRQEDSLTARIAAEPRLASAKLIAEPWDIGTDGYQLGRFGVRWAEWNDKFRDGARALWHPEHQRGALRAFADSLLGSASNFDTPLNSLNFISAHDGFTLADLVSFNHRHNEWNAEDNRDGHGHNLSWNHGEEGPTDNSEIRAERLKTSKALLLTLLLAQGVPMITMGDERGRTQQGNNNAYCQDNPLSWMDWSRDDEGLRDFVKEVLAVRQQHPLLRQPKHLHTTGEVEWRSMEGRILSPQDWEDEALTALFLHLKPKRENDLGLVIAINIGDQDEELKLPAGQWSLSLASDGMATTAVLPSRCIALYVAV